MSDVDYFEDIKVYLDTINVDYGDYDDDCTYYDGIDDVWTVTLKTSTYNSTYKFVQAPTHLEQPRSIFMYNNGNTLHSYEEIIEYLKNHIPAGLGEGV